MGRDIRSFQEKRRVMDQSEQVNLYSALLHRASSTVQFYEAEVAEYARAAAGDVSLTAIADALTGPLFDSVVRLHAARAIQAEAGRAYNAALQREGLLG